MSCFHLIWLLCFEHLDMCQSKKTPQNEVFSFGSIETNPKTGTEPREKSPHISRCQVEHLVSVQARMVLLLLADR